MLNNIKKKLKSQEEKPDVPSCGFCESYKLKDIRYPMEKIKPLWDDIWLKRPLYEVDEEEEKKEKERIDKLQKKVTEIETKQLIQLSINKAIFAQLNPGAGGLTQ
mmetsp:Transcript_5631/g.4841  ORF Transcript_5631/g.4841 Transcript_5631/m.4841 type:complete len:105 (-) Transcript_5631:985-1299(-)